MPKKHFMPEYFTKTLVKQEQEAPQFSLPPNLITVPTRQAAQIVGSSERTLEKWRWEGKGPKYIKSGGLRGRVVYTLQDLMDWLNENRRQSTSDPGPGQPPAAA